MCSGGIIITVIAATLILVVVASKILKSGKSSGFTTPLNAGEKYANFLTALETLKGEFGLEFASKPESLSTLTVSCIGKSDCPLLGGTVGGRQLLVSARLVSDSLLTKIEFSGSFRLPIDAITSSTLHVSGLGMDMHYMGGKPVVKNKLITVRPLDNKAGDETKIALDEDSLKRIEELLRLKPGVMNVSSQIGEFFEKKMTVKKDSVVLLDYGLPQDPKYLKTLCEKLLRFAEIWEKK
ncbi:MAG TPA: hypothetical protein ENN13_03780 [Candidatus Altiarchaeales archaeon]|nr:hypothetical protein [Candidatus Altiarchaeales archaeon]